MKILFIRPSETSERCIPIGITILQAILKQEGHSVKIFDTTFMTKKAGASNKRGEDMGFFKPADMSKYTKIKNCDIKEELLKTIFEFQPDIIGFSVMSVDFGFAKKLVAVIKEKFPHIPVLCGGVHPTVDPEGTIRCKDIDIICVGEGEEALVELLDKIERREDLTNIKNIWIKKEGSIYRNDVRPFVDLDKLPPPDCTGYSQMHLYRPFWGRIYRVFNVEASRGCVFACSECINAQLKQIYKGKGIYHREKSVAKAIADLKYIKEKYGVEIFRFWDEIMFIWSVERCKEFFDLYKKEIALPFICFGRAECMMEEKVKMFKDSGCISISMGIETGNPELRARILNRHMTNEQIIKGFNLCHKYRIRTMGEQMIALPEEKRSHVFDSIMLTRKCNCLSLVSFIYPFQGTPIRKYCLAKGYIKENDPIVDYSQDTIIKNKFISKARQKGLQKTFVLYTLVPRWMFPLIRICEYDNFFFNLLRNKLIKIYRDRLFKRYDKFYPEVPESIRRISALDSLPLGEFK